MRDLANQAAQAAADARDLGRMLQQAGGTQRDQQVLNEVANALQGMSKEGAYHDPLGMQQLMSTTLDKLRKFDLDLRKRLDTSNDQLFLSGSEDVPAGFKSLVDEYSKALSKSGAAAPKASTAPAVPPAPKRGGGGGR